MAERGDSLSDLILLFRFLIKGENENLPGKAILQLGASPKPDFLFWFDPKKKGKKVKTTAKPTFL